MPDYGQIALLIDADNSPSASIEFVLTELAGYGKVNVRRAYGNWASGNLSGWSALLHEHAIQPVQQFDLIKGKNATDIAMTIDAMDLLHTRGIDTYCFMTSDCDFTPLAIRIRAEGRVVIGFGERKVPEAFVNACSTFLYLEDARDKPVAKVAAKQLRGDTRLINLIRAAIGASADEEGWAKLSRVGSHISNQASFDPRNYGYPRLSDLIKAVGLFSVRGKGPTLEILDAKPKG